MAALLVERAETAREADHRRMTGADVAHLQLGLGQVVGRVPCRLPQHPERHRERQGEQHDERSHPEGTARERHHGGRRARPVGRAAPAPSSAEPAAALPAELSSDRSPAAPRPSVTSATSSSAAPGGRPERMAQKYTNGPRGRDAHAARSTLLRP